jgi:hypothetical protein
VVVPPEKTLLLVPFHERGYSRLAEYLERTTLPVYLPLPVELCREPLLSGYLPSGLWGLFRVWSPVLEILRSRANYACYLTLDHARESVNVSTRLIVLVVKARVFEKVDPVEWLRALPERVDTRAPLDWRGVLVVDRFTDYAVLVKKRGEPAQVVVLEDFIPTPLDVLLLVKGGVITWNCDIGEVVEWAVKYIGDYVLTSRDLTEAYSKLRGSVEYLSLLRECTSDSTVLSSLPAQ